MKRICKSFILVLLLMTVLVFPVLAAEKTAVPQTGAPLTVLGTAKASLLEVKGSLPKLGGLLLILVVGSLIAVGIAALAGLIINAIKLEKGAKAINIPDILKKGGVGLSLSELITEIIFFLLIIVTLITALEFYGLSTSSLTSQILSYLPQVVAAVFILVLGILLSLLISGIITLVGGNVKIAQSALLGNIAKYAIIVVSGLIALRELGAGIILSDKSKDIILAGLVLTLALSFGLGAKEKAAKFLNTIFKE